MKVKILARRPEDFVRETKSDIHKVHRNYRLFDNMFIYSLFLFNGWNVVDCVPI